MALPHRRSYTLAKGKVVTKAKEEAKSEDVAESLEDFDLPKDDSDSSEDMTDSGNHVLEAPISAEEEEMSGSRRRSEIPKRFKDLFDESYDVGKSLDSAFVKSSEKFLSKFILDMLNVRSLSSNYSCITLSLGCLHSSDADIGKKGETSSECFRVGVPC